MKRVVWTDEIIEFMIKNYKDKDNKELAQLLNEKFNINTNGDRVSNVKANLKRRKGIDLRTGINRGHIKKGSVPFNKGLKWDEYLSKESQNKSKQTCYKKGHLPHNARKVGEERINVEGYIEIKTGEPDKWEYKHRVVYKEKYGEIPPGHNVIFLDGNRQNLNIDNLKLVTKNEDLIMNRNKLFSNDKNITNTGCLLAKIIAKQQELKNSDKSKNRL